LNVFKLEYLGYHEHLLLGTSLFNGSLTKAEIMDSIGNKIEHRYNNGLASALHVEDIRWRKPCGRVDLLPIERYLLVHDLKRKRVKTKDVVRQAYPHSDPKDVDAARKVNRDNEKAERIKMNVTQGFFPNCPQKYTPLKETWS
jgi:hypothetical protein